MDAPDGMALEADVTGKTLSTDNSADILHDCSNSSCSGFSRKSRALDNLS
jgi:hypothetical protein